MEKNLQGEALYKAMDACIKSYTTPEWCEKLANMGSSNANESLNAMIARKAPKNLHFSSSERLDISISSAVAQKNEGHAYLLEVCQINTFQQLQ